MRKRVLMLGTAAVLAALVFMLGNRLLPVQGQMKPGAGFAVVPGEKGRPGHFWPVYAGQRLAEADFSAARK